VTIQGVTIRTGMGKNLKGKNICQYFLIAENEGTDHILCGRQIASKLKEMGFRHQVYETSDLEHLPKDISTVSNSLELQQDIFPTQAECDLFKRNGSSWFLMDRAGIKQKYRGKEQAFADKLSGVLGQSLVKFDPADHDKFFRA